MSAGRPLRVGVVLEGLALGGCPLNAIDLARTLRGRGHHVVLAAVDEQPLVSVEPRAVAAGFEVVRIPAGAGLSSRAWHLRRLAREHRLDVLHVFAAWLGRSAVLACGLGPTRPVVLNWLMDNEFTTTGRTPLVVGTGDLQREATAVHGPRSYLLEPPVDVLHDRPDPDAAAAFRARHHIAGDELLLTVVGRLDELTPEQLRNHGVAKMPGVMLAIDALLAGAAPRTRLVLVGDGSGMPRVRARADEVNRQLGREAVVLTGALADPRPAYAAADVALAMGGSALRVLAHGRPLVVLGDNGFSLAFEPSTVDRFLDGGYYGTVAPADPVEHLWAQLRPMLDPTTRDELGRWGRDVVVARYGLDATADRLEQIYAETLDQGDAWWEQLVDIGYVAGRDIAGRLARRLTAVRPVAGVGG